MAELYPGPTAAATGLATTYLERGEFEKSAKYYKVLVDSDPKNKFFGEGLAKAEAGKPAK
jgi:hypothetical protein